MSKRKPQQKNVILSPENYIRQRSRNLPIYECQISNTWQDEKIAHIVIARKHVSGNITFCIYLVDTGCLGVRETAYTYNETQETYETYLKKIESVGIKSEKVPYDLVHNIIYAAVEYAEEYGFEPHKDFRLITKYFLEEDTEDIPLIEIECGGEDGKPQYTDNGIDSPARIKQIIKQLEKTVGEGNYHYVIVPNDEEFYDEDEDYYDEELEDEIERLKEEELYGLSIEELKERFFDLFDEEKSKDLTALPENEYVQLTAITEVLIEELTDDEIITDYYSELSEDLTVDAVVNNQTPNSLFQGIQDIDGDTLENLFNGFLEVLSDKKKAQKAISELESKIGDAPLLDYMNFLCINPTNKKKYNKALEECYRKYPDYFLFQMLWHEYRFIVQGVEESLEKFKSLLHDNNLTITHYEYAEYIVRYANRCYNIFDEFNFEKVVALEEFLVDGERPVEYKTITLIASLNIIKIYEMATYLIDEQLG